MTEPTNPTDPTNPAEPATPADAQPDETFGWTTEDGAHASTGTGAVGSAGSSGSSTSGAATAATAILDQLPGRRRARRRGDTDRSRVLARVPPSWQRLAAEKAAPLAKRRAR